MILAAVGDMVGVQLGCLLNPEEHHGCDAHGAGFIMVGVGHVDPAPSLWSDAKEISLLSTSVILESLVAS